MEDHGYGTGKTMFTLGMVRSENMYDLETVKAWALAEIELESQDFIYKDDLRDDGGMVDCRYYEDGTPSCLIGRMLDRNWIFTPDLIDPFGNTGLNDMEISLALNELGLRSAFSAEAQSFMRRLQGGQDRGYSWGLAYESATEGVEPW